MKTKILLSLLMLSSSLTAFCTVFTINNSGNTFTPANITITFGDTVNFVIAGSHDAREVSQTTYNANGNTALPGGFQTPFGGGMVLPAQLAVGTHYFVCTPHAAFGMKGIITVVSCTAPATPGTISGPASVCSGSTNTYSVTAVSGATSYTWTLPGGWSGTSITNSINATASATGGTISVIANNSCGMSSSQNKSVAVVTSAPAAPGTISGNSAICSGTTNVYSITAVSGATSYTWILPSGWSGTSSTPSISATASTSSGNVSVTANNTCGASTPQTLAITVTTAPATPGTISGNSTVCSGTSNTYSITAVNGADSYTWTLPSGWLGTSTANSITTSASSTSGNVTVVAENTCGSSSPQTFAVTVNTVDVFVAQFETTLSASATSATFKWINCSDNLPITGETSSSFTATTNGSYAVIVTQNSCTDTSACFVISTVGIAESAIENGISIYPNPSNDIITIKANDKSLGLSYTITDQMGRQILNGNLTSETTSVDISKLQTGVYFVKVGEGILEVFKL